MEDTYQQNKIELHYWLKDNSHTMDAFTLNRCEWELINLLKEIASTIDIDISIESEAISEGGIIQNFRVAIRKCKEGSITYAVLMTLLTGSIGTPLSIGATKLIEKLFEDDEIISLEKQKKTVEIEETAARAELIKAQTENIKADTEKKNIDNKIYAEKLANNTKITKRSSNFYEQVSKEKKVDKISINLVDAHKNISLKEITVSKSDFINFILSTNELETLIDENASIEIISPVLNKGNYQWKGIYGGETINFNMRSNEFKTLVQTGKVEFKSGTYIRCILEMPRIMNNLGEEIISSYNITKVIGFYNGISFNETDEGKKYIRKKEADKAQLDLFSDINE